MLLCTPPAGAEPWPLLSSLLVPRAPPLKGFWRYWRSLRAGNALILQRHLGRLPLLLDRLRCGAPGGRRFHLVRCRQLGLFAACPGLLLLLRLFWGRLGLERRRHHPALACWPEHLARHWRCRTPSSCTAGHSRSSPLCPCRAAVLPLLLSTCSIGSSSLPQLCQPLDPPAQQRQEVLAGLLHGPGLAGAGVLYRLLGEVDADIVALANLRSLAFC
jgi:hypothetical protein